MKMQERQARKQNSKRKVAFVLSLPQTCFNERSILITFGFRSYFAIACAVTGLMALTIPAQAQTAALDFTGGNTVVFNGDGVAGWTFSVTSDPVSIDALGVWDEDADGLFESHAVGLWDQTGTLIASTTVTNGNSTALASTSTDGQWLFTDISPLTLLAGDYTIGMQALSNSPDVFRIRTTNTTVAGITYGNTIQEVGTTTLDRPTVVFSAVDDGAFGPNLRLPAVAVPEANTFALVLPALGMIGAVMIKRRKK